MLRTLITAGLLALAPAAAHAQTCLGVPTGHDQSAFAGQVGFTDGARLYGVEGSFHMPHDVALVGRFQLRQPDLAEDITTFGGAVAWIAPGAKPSMCPVVGFEYAGGNLTAGPSVPGSMYPGDSFTELSIPVGIGFGGTLRARSVNTTLYAVPQFVWRQLTYDASGALDDLRREWETGIMGLFGVNLSRGMLFGGVAGQFATFEHYDSRLILQLGVMLGGEGH